MKTRYLNGLTLTMKSAVSGPAILRFSLPGYFWNSTLELSTRKVPGELRLFSPLAPWRVLVSRSTESNTRREEKDVPRAAADHMQVLSVEQSLELYEGEVSSFIWLTQLQL